MNILNDVPGWFKKISKLEPIRDEDGEVTGRRSGVRGDYQLLTLLTGLRKMGPWSRSVVFRRS